MIKKIIIFIFLLKSELFSDTISREVYVYQYIPKNNHNKEYLNYKSETKLYEIISYYGNYLTMLFIKSNNNKFYILESYFKTKNIKMSSRLIESKFMNDNFLIQKYYITIEKKLIPELLINSKEITIQTNIKLEDNTLTKVNFDNYINKIIMKTFENYAIELVQKYYKNKKPDKFQLKLYFTDFLDLKINPSNILYIRVPAKFIFEYIKPRH